MLILRNVVCCANAKKYIAGALSTRIARCECPEKKNLEGVTNTRALSFSRCHFLASSASSALVHLFPFFLFSFWHVMLFKVGTTKREEVILVSPTGSGALQLVTRSKEKGENRTIISFPPFTWYFWIFQTVFP